MAKSYFAILGISSGATGDEIRSAYRRLAKEFHPDHYEGGSERFRDIQEAYSVIGNSRRRREYEQNIRKVSPKTPLRHTYYPEPEPLIPEENPVDLGGVSPVRSFQSFTPSFDEIFDWLWRNFSSLEQPKSGRVKNLTLEVPLAPEQARRGGNARIMVPAQAVCPTCQGQGNVGFYECTRCAGEGIISGEMPVSVFVSMGANILANALTPEAAAANTDEILRRAKIVKAFTLTSPMELYTDATATIIDPMQKSARSIVTMGPLESLSISRFSGPLRLSQSVLIVVPYIISLVAITIICFAVSYTVFMRQEIRSL